MFSDKRQGFVYLQMENGCCTAQDSVSTTLVWRRSGGWDQNRTERSHLDSSCSQDCPDPNHKSTFYIMAWSWDNKDLCVKPAGADFAFMSYGSLHIATFWTICGNNVNKHWEIEHGNILFYQDQITNSLSWALYWEQLSFIPSRRWSVSSTFPRDNISTELEFHLTNDPQRRIPVVLHQRAGTKDRFLETKKAAYVTKRKIQSSLNWLLKSVRPKISDQASQIQRSCRRTAESAFKKKTRGKVRRDGQSAGLTDRQHLEGTCGALTGWRHRSGRFTHAYVRGVTKALGTHLELRTSALRAWMNPPCQIQGEHGGCA